MKQQFPVFGAIARNDFQGLLMLGGVAMISSCAAPETAKTDTATATTTVASSTTATAAPAAAASAPPPVALPHDQAVQAAAKDLFSKAKLPPGKSTA